MIILTRTIAAEAGCETIDVHAAASNHPELFGDGVHPTDDGKALIAKTIGAKIAEKKTP